MNGDLSNKDPNKKRILFIHTQGYTYPIPRVRLMAESLQSAGYDVHAICVPRDEDRPPSEEIHGVKVWNINYDRTDSTRNLIGLLKLNLTVRRSIFDLVEKLKPDAVQIFSPLLLPVGARIKRKLGISLIYDCYEYYVRGKLTEGKPLRALLNIVVELYGYSYLDGIIVVSEWNPTLRIVSKKTKIAIILNSKKKTDLQGVPDPDRAELGLDKSDFVIGYLGIITGQKGYDDILRCVCKLPEDVKLLIIGGSEDGSDKIYQELAKQLGVSERVRFIGFVPSYQKAMSYSKSMDIGLWLPDHRSVFALTLPNKIFEYMALGKPFITTDNRSMRIFVDKIMCAAMVPPHEIDKLSEKIMELKGAPEIRKEMGERGMRAFFNDYSWEVQETRLLSMYGELFARLKN